MRTLIYLLTIACIVAAPAWAQDQPSLDELLDLEKPAPSAEERPAPATEPTMDDALRRQLEGGGAGDAMEAAVDEMRQVTSRLGRDQDPGLSTQRMMESILNKLDQLISKAEQQSQQSSQSSSQQQGQASNQDSQAQQVAQQNAGQQPGQQPGEPQPGPASDSRDAGVTHGTAVQQELDHRPMEALRREWGDLPPRLRDELREGLDERFSPVYQRLTEEYYRRLAEEE